MDCQVHATHIPHPTAQPQKDQLIFNTAKLPTMNATAINLIFSTKDGIKLNCTFGTVMTNFLAYFQNLRITFPDQDIAIHTNNVKSCLRQLKNHPNVMGVFSFIIDTIMFLQCGLTFGLDFSPANWEPTMLLQIASHNSLTTTTPCLIFSPSHRTFPSYSNADASIQVQK